MRSVERSTSVVGCIGDDQLAGSPAQSSRNPGCRIRKLPHFRWSCCFYCCHRTAAAGQTVAAEMSNRSGRTFDADWRTALVGDQNYTVPSFFLPRSKISGTDSEGLGGHGQDGQSDPMQCRTHNKVPYWCPPIRKERDKIWAKKKEKKVISGQFSSPLERRGQPSSFVNLTRWHHWKSSSLNQIILERIPRKFHRTSSARVPQKGIIQFLGKPSTLFLHSF